MKINYRPEIDGLRAIAVCAVILYHAGIKNFQGGFLGVDIFFVISGYLITSIILKELKLTRTFSFKNFYERRIRRIIPVLLFVITASLPLAWLYLLPVNFIEYSKSILSSIGFTSNIYFLNSGLQYGAESSLLKPFLHTWSLSVEEQYYILFPIILLIIFKFFKKNLIYLLIFGFFLSLGYAHYLSKYFPSHNFYILPTRGWELLAGSLLAYYELKKINKFKFKLLNSLLPLIGILSIILSIYFFNDKIPHPSLYTLVPVIGVSLVIWFSKKDEFITNLLSSRIFVGVGLISYSLYLWHYPIFAFDRITDHSFSNFELIIIIIIFSLFSYFFIEKPFRSRKYRFKKVSFIIVALCLFNIFINSKIIFSNGYENRFYSTNTYKLNSIIYEKENYDFEMNYNYDNYNERKNVLIIGNSHAEDLLEILSKTNLTDKIYFNLASPLKRDPEYNFEISDFYKFLIKKDPLFEHFKKQYKKSNLLIISTRFINENRDLEILGELIKLLKKDKKKIIVFDHALEQTLKTSYLLNRLDYYIYLNNRFPNKDRLYQIEREIYKDLSNREFVNKNIKKITEQNDVILIERKKIFCNIDQMICPSITDDGYKIYWDYGHITSEGAKYFAKKFEKDKFFIENLNFLLDIQID